MELTAEEIERTHIRSRKMYQMDLAHNLAVSKQIGFEKGFKKGLMIGIEKGIKRGIEKCEQDGKMLAKLMCAKNALLMGISVDVVQTLTDLTYEEIAQLQKEE